jgi:hypothetical protein
MHLTSATTLATDTGKTEEDVRRAADETPRIDPPLTLDGVAYFAVADVPRIVERLQS